VILLHEACFVYLARISSASQVVYGAVSIFRILAIFIPGTLQPDGFPNFAELISIGMAEQVKVFLKKGKEMPVLRFHPWIFSGAVREIRGAYQEGDIAEVYADDGRFLAVGYLLSGSISIKLLTFQKEAISGAFWKNKLASAYRLRKDLGLTRGGDTNCYRLVHNEGDGMPGLIIDIYNDLAVIQSHSVGMYLQRDTIAGLLPDVTEGTIRRIYDKSSESLKKMTSMRVKDEFLLGGGDECEVLEHGHRFLVNPVSGQKTGFFLDQRENRRLLGGFSAGRRVLNMFGYTGGFSVYAAARGAVEVVTVDSSAPALELADRNLKLNGYDSVKYRVITEDARKFLDTVNPGDWDLVILDPPAYGKNLESRKKALMGYRNINAAALRKISKGGILFTFSCSQVVDRSMFYSAVTAAAIDVGKKVRVLHQLSQPPDHPLNLFHQEGEYLKGLVLRVED